MDKYSQETRFSRGKLLLLLALWVTLVSGISGCRQRAGLLLLGEWIGRPDTVEARAAREAEKYGEPPADVGTKRKTDWEAYDVSLRFNFASPTRLEMSRADGTEPVEGTWKVLETTPTGCTIEVVTTDEQTKEEVLKRLRIEFDERQGELVGFLLSEAGADRNLGAIYFSRAVAGPPEQ